MPSQRPIRVMRIIARLNIGGPAIHITLLTEAMQSSEFESSLVCGQIGEYEGDMAYLAEEHGVTPFYIDALGRELAPLRDVVTLFKLWRLIRRVRPDVVHTHTAKAGFVGRIAAWLAGVPVRLHTYHGHVFYGYFSPAKTRLFLWLERIIGRLSDQLVTISPSLRDELAHTYHIAPAEKFTLVHLGLALQPFADTPRHSGEFRAQFNISAAAPLIGIVGRIVPIKNHALFLEAARRVRDVIPNAHFVIVGDGELRAAVETQVAALGLHDAVTFTGFLRDLRPVYSDMDVLVISSDNEGTPVSIIEALAAGVPVVSTAVGGVPDLLRQGAFGRLTPPGDPAALADAMAAALHENVGDLQAIQTAIIAEYDIKQVVADLSTLYRDLLAAKRKGPAYER
jgi:glycosyltransferase involved in cell wall biosynthesis